MFTAFRLRSSFSELAFKAFVGCIAATVALSVADGFVKGFPGPLTPYHLATSTWITDFRYLFEQGVYASTTFWVGSKFIETRTLLTIGFDRLDAHRISVRGPDEANIVWIGRKYGEKLEAEAVAAAIQERLHESAASNS